jgi:hypothetical protein
MKVFIVIDEEDSPKDAVYSIHASREGAEKSEKEFKDMCVGGRNTVIVEGLFEDSKLFAVEMLNTMFNNRSIDREAYNYYYQKYCKQVRQ